MSVANEERNYTVYIHVNKKNNKTYIGITRQKPNVRWKKDGKGYKNSYMGNAIEKYGWENFEHIILFDNKTKEEAEELEILYIKVLMSNNREYGYNILNGGNCVGQMSDETKEKLREIHTGSNNPIAKKVICDGKEFGCIKECAEYYNIKKGTMTSWLLRINNMPKKFIELGLKYVDKVNSTYNAQTSIKEVFCDNKIFESSEECAKYYNVKYGTMRSWLIGTSGMPDEFYTKGLRYLHNTSPVKKQNYYKKVICSKIIFNSLKECSEYYKIPKSTLCNYLKDNRPTPQKYIDLGLRYYNPEVDGDIEQYEQYIETKAI